mmetsp:Transcript_49486/g.78319  ORF Transcript_49486/g.78319 Transcript_49486/m.78319 type:complete len:194 (+) Transcript_49486:61-642(+)|eukprot:CAMPEP_0169311946 /NCGR_PEP_ID=MMETSP1017-20121227/3769_1 /TAXON_ID=342587 /ORGANISM="Karlodinium micrum, Strain CCMP2283" /LENGTH=193 /DNA_ID=CAMNT_0009405679 /DNA_START=49 /DNA_END=630 /DNA_ORIENTATION=+
MRVLFVCLNCLICSAYGRAAEIEDAPPLNALASLLASSQNQVDEKDNDVLDLQAALRDPSTMAEIQAILREAYADAPVAHADPPVAHADPPVAHADAPVAYADPPEAYADADADADQDFDFIRHPRQMTDIDKVVQIWEGLARRRELFDQMQEENENAYEQNRALSGLLRKQSVREKLANVMLRRIKDKQREL